MSYAIMWADDPVAVYFPLMCYYSLPLAPSIAFVKYQQNVNLITISTHPTYKEYLRSSFRWLGFFAITSRWLKLNATVDNQSCNWIFRRSSASHEAGQLRTATLVMDTAEEEDGRAKNTGRNSEKKKNNISILFGVVLHDRHGRHITTATQVTRY